MTGIERMSSAFLTCQVVSKIYLPVSRFFVEGVDFSYKRERMSCSRREVKTEHLTGQTTDAHFSRARDTSSKRMRWFKIK